MREGAWEREWRMCVIGLREKEWNTPRAHAHAPPPPAPPNVNATTTMAIMRAVHMNTLNHTLPVSFLLPAMCAVSAQRRARCL